MRSRVLNILQAVRRFFAKHGKALGKAALTVLLLLVAVLPAVVDNTVIGYLPALMVVLGVIVSFAYIQVLKRSVTFEDKLEVSSCLRGEVADASVKVCNASFLLCPRIEVVLFISDLEGNVDTRSENRFSLLPKESHELELAARFDHIGCYQVGLRSIKVYDIFGLFSYEHATSKPQTIQVEPRIVELRGLELVRQAETDAARLNHSVINDGFDYVGMREYLLGDSMKSIHWKSSARYDTLMTRLYEMQINPSLCVVVDNTSRWPHGEQMMFMYDAVVEAALSIVDHASRNGIECTLVTCGPSGEACDFLPRSTWGFMDLMEAMPSLIPSKENKSLAQVVHTLSLGMYSSSNLIVVSSNPTELLLSEVISAHVSGKHTAYLLAHPSDWEHAEENAVMRMIARLSAARVPHFTYSDVRQIKEV